MGDLYNVSKRASQSGVFFTHVAQHFVQGGTDIKLLK